MPQNEDFAELFCKLNKKRRQIIKNIIIQLEKPHKYTLLNNTFINLNVLDYIGDIIRIHHCFSKEPFTKEKFEHALEQSMLLDGRNAKLAPKGNPGHDITIDNICISLKTQADKNISENKIHISKFMELGKGKWANENDLIGLRERFFNHMNAYERIFILRRLNLKKYKGKKNFHEKYELVEIPKDLLLKAKNGKIEMRHESKQNPKPGYCYIYENDEKIFELYFDGGTERKLQIKNINKGKCILHSIWEFDSI